MVSPKDLQETHYAAIWETNSRCKGPEAEKVGHTQGTATRWGS